PGQSASRRYPALFQPEKRPCRLPGTAVASVSSLSSTSGDHLPSNRRDHASISEAAEHDGPGGRGRPGPDPRRPGPVPAATSGPAGPAGSTTAGPAGPAEPAHPEP